MGGLIRPLWARGRDGERLRARFSDIIRAVCHPHRNPAQMTGAGFPDITRAVYYSKRPFAFGFT